MPSFTKTKIALCLGSLPLLLLASHAHAEESFTYKRLVKDLRVTSPSNIPSTPEGLEASSGTVSFSSVNANTTSPAQSVLIRNRGLSAVPLTSVAVTEGASLFSATHNCPSSLLPDAVCAVSVRFAPTQAGTSTGRILVSSGSSELSIALTGTAVVQPVAGVDLRQWSYYGLDYSGSVQWRFEQFNPNLGNVSPGQSVSTVLYLPAYNVPNGLRFGATVDNSLFSLTSAGKFKILYQGGWGEYPEVVGCGATVSPAGISGCQADLFNQSYPFGAATIRFTAPAGASAGVHTANVSVTHNVPGIASPVVIPVQARIVTTPVANLSATSLTWSDSVNPVQVGSSGSQSVQLTSAGTEPVSITGITQRQGGAPFQTSHNCPESLPVGDSCVITVQFSPTSSVTSTNFVDIATSAGVKTVSLSGTAAAPVDPGFSNVVLLTQVKDGAIRDTSSFGASLTVGSGVSIDSAIAKFPGTSSMAFTSSSSGILAPYLANKFDFANTVTTWTVESWVYLKGSQSSIQTYRLDVAGNQGSSNGWEAAISTGGLAVVYPGFGGPGQAASLAANRWYHLVWQRNGNNYTFGVDGVILGSVTYSGGKAANSFMRVGGNFNNSVGIAYNLQDVRLTRNTVRYPGGVGATYSVPTQPLPMK